MMMGQNLDHKTNSRQTFLRGLYFTVKSYTVIFVDDDDIFLNL